MSRDVTLYVYVLLFGSVATSWDQVEFVNNVGRQICPYTNFCYTNATKTIKDKTKMACCLPCDCTDSCWKEGICCPDKSEAESVPSILVCRGTLVKQLSHKKEEYNGIRLGIPRYRITASCPSNEVNATLVGKCEGKNKSRIEDYTWVSETESGRIFQNQYCAYCNGINSFVAWNIRAIDPKILYSNFSFLSQYMQSASLELEVELPEIEADLAERYRCFTPDYSKCNQTGTWRRKDENIEAACEKYYSPILQYNTISRVYVYKNIYCFYCNPFSTGEIMDTCLQIDQLMRSADYDFSALVDFRQRERVLKGAPDADCNVDEVYDRHMKSCYKLYCPFGKAPFYGKCDNIALQTKGLAVRMNYYLRIVLNRSPIQPDDLAVFLSDNKLVGNTVISNFDKVFGARKASCPVCKYRLEKVNHNYTNLEFMLSAILYTNSGCQLDVITELGTRVLAKEIKINIDENLYLTFSINLAKQSIFDLKTETVTVFDKNWARCRVMYALKKETICPEINLRYSMLTSQLKLGLSRLHYSILSNKEDSENTTITVCWSDYLSVWSQINVATSHHKFVTTLDLTVVSTILSLIN